MADKKPLTNLQGIDKDEQFTSHEFADLLGVKVSTVRRWARFGLENVRLPHDRICLKQMTFTLRNYEWWQAEVLRGRPASSSLFFMVIRSRMQSRRCCCR
jgi:hypothetical protein